MSTIALPFRQLKVMDATVPFSAVLSLALRMTFIQSVKGAKDQPQPTFQNGASPPRIEDAWRVLLSKREQKISSALYEGARVKARYRGKALYYPGVIKHDHGDGTYDIDYDDVRNKNRY